MIQNKVYRLLETSQLTPELKLDKGTELEIVMDVVYMGGYMLPPSLQPLLYNWIINNPKLFKDDTRKF